jgi:mRNA-degrading endonuclease RelE of RelBE toxin-antitoxin system
VTFQVKLTASAAEMFGRLHPEARKNIKTGLKGLNENPHLGKPLQNELALFRSLKLKRFRVVCRIDDANTRVVVYVIGHRKDIYEVILEWTTGPG